MDSEAELSRKTEKPGLLRRALTPFRSSPPHSNHHSSVPHQLMPSSKQQLMPPPPHPLELPEILELVVAYLQRSCLRACALVCKAWCRIFAPFIWNDIYLNKLPDSTRLIQRHSHLVKKVRAGYMSKEYAAVRFQNLLSLKLDTQDVKDYHIQFVIEHPTVNHLALGYFVDCPPTFWGGLLGFPRLRTLSMSSRALFDDTNIEKFWQLCTRLERLEIEAKNHSIFKTIPPGEFSRMKSLEVNMCPSRSVPFFMEFLRRCPVLTTIRWHTDTYDRMTFMSGMTKLLEAKALPCLEHLDVNAIEVPNNDVAKVISNMPQATTLVIHLNYNLYKMDFATILRPHFMNLRVLEVIPAQQVKSRMAQDVMSSCPLLEKLKAPYIDADDVAKGKPWVCLRLKVLHLGFVFDPPNSVPSVQPLVFDQLSKLTQLEEWCNSGPYQFAGTVDLRLESGLGKLSTLRRLRTVTLINAVEKMGEQDVDWILKHWKGLRMFRGGLHTRDEAVRKALRKKLTSHGIHQ